MSRGTFGALFILLGAATVWGLIGAFPRTPRAMTCGDWARAPHAVASVELTGCHAAGDALVPGVLSWRPRTQDERRVHAIVEQSPAAQARYRERHGLDEGALAVHGRIREVRFALSGPRWVLEADDVQDRAFRAGVSALALLALLALGVAQLRWRGRASAPKSF